MTPFQVAVLWQLSQVGAVAMCLADLPVVMTPLWQLKQVPITKAWVARFMIAPVHTLVLTWHPSQLAVVRMCRAP